MDFKARGLKGEDWALAGLGEMAGLNRVITRDMLAAALAARFRGEVLETARKVAGF